MKYLKDIYGFIGIALIGYGLWLYDPRISFVTVGGLLFSTSLLASMRR